jgi:hypothetical protein
MTQNINSRLDRIEAKVVPPQPKVYPPDIIQLQRQKSFRGWTMFGANPTKEMIDQRLIDTWKRRIEAISKDVPSLIPYFQSAIDQLGALPWPEVEPA